MTRAALAPDLRPAQARALEYAGGRLAISAAPGSGKTFILTRLVVRLVADLGVRPDQILVLTYMRSAALTFRTRVGAELASRGLSARGLAACTIHAFCQRVLRHDLGRFEDAGDLAAEGRFSVMADSEQAGILRRGLQAYLADPRRADIFAARCRGRDPEDARRDAVEAARKAISAAKQARRSPGQLAEALAGVPEIGFLARYYHDHQQAMRLLDFDDLLLGAVDRLRGHPALLAHFRETCRYLLEDEAQDSTPVQHDLLALLAGPDGNLVRVGDPNQAIMSSFTNSAPGLFREFCAEHPTVFMAESSRSARPVIGLANRLVAMAASHADPAVRRAFGGAPIEIATAGPRNPEAPPDALTWSEFRDREEEIPRVVEDVRQHLRRYPGDTCAVLCVANSMIRAADGGGFLAVARAAGLDVFDDGGDRPRAGSFLLVLRHAFRALDSLDRGAAAGPDAVDAVAALADALAAHRGRRTRGVAALARAAAAVGLDRLVFAGGRLRPALPAGVLEADYVALLDAAEALEAWLGFRQAPLADMCLAAAGLLAPGDAEAPLIAAKVARMVGNRLAAAEAPALRSARGTGRAVREFLAEVSADGRQAARLLAEAAESRAPGPGQVVITTLHKSKGAEYDAVWIPNLGYGFGQGRSQFPWEAGEVRIFDEAAILAERMARGEEGGAAALAAYRQEVIGERLRLLYVGITRARRRLALSGYAWGKDPIAPAHVLALAREIRAGTEAGPTGPGLPGSRAAEAGTEAGPTGPGLPGSRA
ncbi:MAG: ATP-dependent helicase, partial [Candidatus Sericytochromatia bacterium]|nr:ATP-dependent helicase [Candidatus Tanganyikabacteria bacterium]